MQAVTGEGRTVLFVSHNLAAVDQLCDRAMLLERGRKVTEGATGDVIDSYLQSLRREASLDLSERADRTGSGRLLFERMRLHLDGEPADTLVTGRDADVLLDYAAPSRQPLRNVNFAVLISTLLGETMLHLYTVTRGEMLRELPPEGTVRCHIPRLPLPAGQYHVTLWADVGGSSGEVLDWIQHAFELTVAEGDFFGTGQPPMTSHRAVLVEHTWQLEPANVVS
jgi:lipopolysaccharide transport system ATP-binding protein